VFVLVVDPLLATLDRLERQTVRKQKDIHELAVLADAYRDRQGRLAKAESRLPSPEQPFSLLAFLEEAATSAHVRERITGAVVEENFGAVRSEKGDRVVLMTQPK